MQNVFGMNVQNKLDFFAARDKLSTFNGKPFQVVRKSWPVNGEETIYLIEFETEQLLYAFEDEVTYDPDEVFIPEEWITVEFGVTTVVTARAVIEVSKSEFEAYTGECFSQESLAQYLEDFVYENCLQIGKDDQEVESEVWEDIHIVS